MKTIAVEKSWLQYLRHTLGVSAVVYEQEASPTDAIETPPMESSQIHCIQECREAWLWVLLDAAYGELSVAEQELLERMLAVTKIAKDKTRIAIAIGEPQRQEGFLAQLRSCKKILVLGENAKAWVELATKPLADHRSETYFATKILCSFSLRHLLENEADKKILWAGMQEWLR